ncbi:NADPH-dependent FMN reductase [Streptomyces rochei]|uniref:NADPH-dependent FMN reductase n=1 Tax=Streptomyces rochei TaxID=1928 RepID=UPI00363DF2F3
MTKIVLVSGSLRRDSLNTTALRTVRRLVRERPAGPDGPHEVAMLSVGLLPLYDGDVERCDGSAAVREAKELLRGADALIVSTPSYNGEMSGALKNALDWLSRPGGASPLTGRVVALLSASPGARGGVDAQPALRGVLSRCGALVVDHEPVALGRAGELPVTDGEFTDPAVVGALGGLLDAVFAAVRQPVDVPA